MLALSDRSMVTTEQPMVCQSQARFTRVALSASLEIIMADKTSSSLTKK